MDFNPLKKLKAETAERTYRLEGDALARYNFAKSYSENKSIIDVGTGLGHGAWLLSQNTKQRVVGVDAVADAVREANRLYQRPNLKFLHFDMLEGVNPARELGLFDVAIAFEIIEHLKPEAGPKFLENLKSVLDAQGVLLLSTPNKLITSPNTEKPGNPYHLKEYLPEEFAALLRRHFSDVSLLGIRLENKEYLEKREQMTQTLRRKFVAWLSSHRIMHELFFFIPKGIKSRVTGDAQLPQLRESDFGIHSDSVETCDILLGVCRK